MTPSYEVINYSLRPAKQIERKMICEATKRLCEFGTLESYRYIGFGSIYFSDFAMFHKQLNISSMLSIERDEHKKDRFEFNKPFDCIEMEYAKSTSVLPTLNWEQRSIVWLDYDGQIDGDTIADITSFFANAISGSMLVVTVNSQYKKSEECSRLDQLRKSVGKDLVPTETKESDLAGWTAATTIRQIVSSSIEKSINVRNGGRPFGNKLTWKQTLSFEYADGAKMTTLGGIIVEEGQLPHFDKCNFSELSFTKLDPTEFYRIEVPALTYRELKHLDKQLPQTTDVKLEAAGIPERDVKRYSKVYRYFPTFAEADL